MKGNTIHRGARRSSMIRRLTVVIAAATTLSLAFAAGSASAKTVYDYVYSGSSFNGADTVEIFPPEASSIFYDAHRERIFVGVSARPGNAGYVSRFTKAGVASPFSGLASPTTFITPGHGGMAQAQIAVDQSNGSTDGNIYVGGNPGGSQYKRGFTPDGKPLPLSFEESGGNGKTGFLENFCGIAVDPTGRVWSARGLGFGITLSDGTEIPSNEYNDYYQPYSPALEAKQGSSWGSPCRPVIDSQGYIYSMYTGTTGRVKKLEPLGGEGNPFVNYAYGKKEVYELTKNTSGSIAVDYSNDDVFVTGGGKVTQFDDEGDRLGEHAFSAESVAIDPVSHDMWALDGSEVKRYERVNPITIPDTTPAPVELDNPAGTTAVIKGLVNPDGIETTDCYFEFGQNHDVVNKVDCAEGDNFTGSTAVSVSAEISTELAKRYFFRLSAKNANGRVSLSTEGNFIAQGRPKVTFVHVDRVNTDGARMSGDIDANGGNTTFHFDWGLEGQGFEDSGEESEAFGFKPNDFTGASEYDPGFHSQGYLATGLLPGETYEYRLVATNEAGVTFGPTEKFTTYVADPGSDPCPNSHARQQTGSALLPECRVYELVSSRYTGGYDVVSDIVPGQVPFNASPRAKDRLLYSVHFGVIPNLAGSPTNLGRDPYVASRDPDEGWSTEYVGLPSDGMPDKGKFGSPLLAADAALSTFAFGGPDICDPCFKDGLGESSNIPLRLSDGTLVKGMAGSLSPHADSDGYLEERFSADGSHFLFGSSQKFEPAGEEGEVSIYDRNLETGTTQVVSTLPSGDTMDGSVGEPAALDISDNGTRVVVAEKVSTDTSGNAHWHPYMHVGTSSNSVDLAPGTTTGVLYNGMDEDGTRVFFTTKDKLLGTDTDVSSDLYEAAVDGGGTLSLRLITTKAGAPSNDDSCEPPGKPDSWNAVEGTGGMCNPVAFAGGAGVASGNGTFYFMSPELLDGANGVEDQANLYFVSPGGTPKFVETIDSSLVKPPPLGPQHPLVGNVITGLSEPEGIAVDQATGDIYVVERGGGGRIARYTSAGAAKNFAVPGGSNKIANSGIGGQGEAQIAYDSAAASPMKNSFYVRNGASTVAVYSSSGEKVGSLVGFNEACGVAVDNSSGTLYVGDYTYGGIRRFIPNAVPTLPIDKTDYTETGVKTLGVSPCAVGASATRAYAVKYNTGPINAYPVSEFAAVPPALVGETVAASARAVYTDPSNADLYVSEANQIGQYNSAGVLQQKYGLGSIGNNARGVAVDQSSGATYVQFGTNIVKFGFEEPPYAPIDNRAVTNGVHDSEERTFEDIQVSPDGRYAAFNSVIPLTGYPTVKHEEIYRYDSITETTDCVSCPPSGIAAQNDASLSSQGLNLSDDGRVFFTTLDELALRDANGRLDVYEWSDGKVGILSTGVGEEDSGLVTASADGTDVFFYTRDKLHEFDENGKVVKVYDARAGGGFPVDPPRLPCAASDECHGPGTPQPPPPNINADSPSGVPPVSKPLTCKKGFVKRRGRCVKRPQKKHPQKKRQATRRHG